MAPEVGHLRADLAMVIKICVFVCIMLGHTIAESYL